jgi:predicted regulator of Ras-like GTPase activity (Roadblock/LC7/MglB family)
MHWLETQVERLHGLAQKPQSRSSGLKKELRREFLDAVAELAAATVQRAGVSACFVCHDGLLIETAGRASDFEALSAMTQHWMVAGNEAAATLALGRVQQMVIIGDEHKLALFVIGQLAVGILSPSAVVLSRVLAS